MEQTHRSSDPGRFLLFVLAVWILGGVLPAGAEDYLKYVKESKDFQRVGQEREILLHSRWQMWVQMPWRYQWGRPYDDSLAKELKEAGFNGGFCDHRAGPDADLHEKYGLLWYLDHAAGKGSLHLHAEAKKKEARELPNRPVCLADPAVAKRLKDLLSASVGKAKGYKTRIAYALDDEISWSSFTSPCKWDNSPASIAGFNAWLLARYQTREEILKEWGPGSEPYLARMMNPDDLQELYQRPLGEWNLAPWCDALSYMDSQINNLMGDLVSHSNQIDPETPCGYVGGQAPAPYGGYDYSKIMRKVQFLEAYDIGGNMEMVRSFNPGNMLPTVKTGFGDPASKEGTWFNWYYMVHGDRGSIAWAEGWFKGGRGVPPWGSAITRMARYSTKLIGAKWKHDGVALYYSHPSIQVSWFLDCQKHGRTWINRSSSINNSFSSSIGVTWAWEKLLEDERLQYNWVSYPDLVEKGGLDPKEYKVLILPRVLALSDEEAAEIRRYIQAGGQVIADHLTGLFDQHGKARAKPVLDDLFGIAQRPPVTSEDLFNGKQLTESDAESAFGKKKSFIGAGEMIWDQCLRAQGLIQAQRSLAPFQGQASGKGFATHMNVSLNEYCKIRGSNFKQAKAYRAPVTGLLEKAAATPWVTLQVKGSDPEITEATYWEKDGRVLVCVVKNPLKFASEFGETKTEGITKETVDLTLEFAFPVSDCSDEIAEKKLGDGKRFTIPWKGDEAAILSFRKPEP